MYCLARHQEGHLHELMQPTKMAQIPIHRHYTLLTGCQVFRDHKSVGFPSKWAEILSGCAGSFISPTEVDIRRRYNTTSTRGHMEPKMDALCRKKRPDFLNKNFWTGEPPISHGDHSSLGPFLIPRVLNDNVVVAGFLQRRPANYSGGR